MLVDHLEVDAIGDRHLGRIGGKAVDGKGGVEGDRAVHEGEDARDFLGFRGSFEAGEGREGAGGDEIHGRLGVIAVARGIDEGRGAAVHRDDGPVVPEGDFQGFHEADVILGEGVDEPAALVAIVPVDVGLLGRAEGGGLEIFPRVAEEGIEGDAEIDAADLVIHGDVIPMGRPV